MKKGLLLISSLLIVQLALCQSGYPKLIVNKGDSIVAFTTKQVKTLQLAKINYDECVEVKDSLKLQLQEAVKIIDLQKQAINSFDKERAITSLLIANNDSKDREYKNTIETLNKQLKKRTIANKFIGGGLIISVGVIFGLLIAN